jgi:hypothetical protein
MIASIPRRIDTDAPPKKYLKVLSMHMPHCDFNSLSAAMQRVKIVYLFWLLSITGCYENSSPAQHKWNTAEND